MARVQMKLAGGTYYTFPINPVEFDDKDSYEFTTKRTLDGKSIEQYSNSDGRIRTMTWHNLPNRSPYAGGTDTLIPKLKSYVMQGECILKLRSLSKIGSTQEDSIKVIDVTTMLSPGAGPQTADDYLKYSTIQMKYIVIVPIA